MRVTIELDVTDGSEEQTIADVKDAIADNTDVSVWDIRIE